jgi:hypothetical protein
MEKVMDSGTMEELVYFEIFTETKCRRCGKLHEWHFLSGDDRAMQERLRFIDLLNERIDTHEVHFCEKCKKNTIHDMVSYEINNDKPKN